jgi:two-component system cell cycle sensor histidine kinase/response regulator CckA
MADQTLRVLHVEDSERDVALLTRHLARAGYDLTFERVETPEAMRAALETRQWDVILCDYSMPHFNALSALALLKETGLDIPLIIISGTIGEEIAVEAMRAGAHDYLMKDNLVRLAPTIERELHEAENRRARRQAEEERAQLIAQLESQQQRLNNIVASVPGVVWEAWGEPDAATQRIDFVNDYVETMLGYSVEEWLQTPNFWLSIVHPEDRERAARSAAANYARGGQATLEFRWVAKDGRVVWVESNSVVITDDKGRSIGLRGVNTDISERKRAEEKLIQSERQLAEAQQLAHVGNWNWDLQSNTLTWSDEHYRMFGLQPQEFTPSYQALLEYVHPQDRDRVTETVERSLKTLEPFSYHIRVIQPNGEVRIIHSRGNVTSNEQVQPIRVFGTAQDVTERKQAEEKIRQAEEKYRSIFENAVEGIFQSTPDGRFISVNPAMVRILGYESAEELMAHRTDIGTQHYVDANSRMELEQMLAEQGIVMGYECEVYRKDLSKIWTVENIRAIHDESGAVLHYEGSIEDITERKTLAEQLRQSQKLEAIGMLAGGIAHDFNNLLTAITGYSDLTLWRLREEDPLHRNISEVKKAAERAAALTRQLLAFSRKQVLQPKTLDLNGVVSDLEKMLRRLIGEDVELRTVLEPELGSVRADPGQIEQVLMNLAVNARDAMPHGGKLTIETENVYLDDEYVSRHIAVHPGSYVMLAVSDTGTGMDEQTRARIFEPFFTTKGIGRGTGLGLSTVYGIVKQSGGSIWVYSEVGRGTTFKVYLPRVDESAQEYKQSAEVRESVQGTETVLLAEDEEIVRELAREVLEAYGYQVLVATNGGSALLICERHKEPIHLLVTDVVMPEMSGRELADRLSQLRPEMKVLYMSGYTDNAIVHQGVLDEGANFIQKPFAPNALARKVREVLDREDGC